MVRVSEYRSCDVDDQAQALEGWQQSYEQLGCGRFSGLARQSVMDQGVLLREVTNRPLREEIMPPADQFVLAVPLQVEPGSMFAGRPLVANSLIALLPGQQCDLVATGSLDLMAVSVRRPLLDGLEPGMVEWLEALRHGRAIALPGAQASTARAELASAMERSERLDGSWAEGALLASVTEGLLHSALAADQPGMASALPRRASGRSKVVRRAVDFMRAKLQDDIGMAEICSAACASRRTLQYCFEELLHTTPQAYLRALRLNQARRTLKSSPGRAITELATELCFSSASHFTQHYKVMFDELPSQTLRTALSLLQ